MPRNRAPNIAADADTRTPSAEVTSWRSAARSTAPGGFPVRRSCRAKAAPAVGDDDKPKRGDRRPAGFGYTDEGVHETHQTYGQETGSRQVELGAPEAPRVWGTPTGSARSTPARRARAARPGRRPRASRKGWPGRRRRAGRPRPRPRWHWCAARWACRVGPAGYAARSIPSVAGCRSAPKTPWATRRAITPPTLAATASRPTRPRSPARRRRRPGGGRSGHRGGRRRRGGSRRRPDSRCWSTGPGRRACRSRWRAGWATVRTVPSRATTAAPTTLPASGRVRRRRARGSPGSGPRCASSAATRSGAGSSPPMASWRLPHARAGRCRAGWPRARRRRPVARGVGPGRDAGDEVRRDGEERQARLPQPEPVALQQVVAEHQLEHAAVGRARTRGRPGRAHEPRPRARRDGRRSSAATRAASSTKP